MNIDIIIDECIEQAEQLKFMINCNGEKSVDFLGGTMKPVYEKIRIKQSENIDMILRQLRKK